MVACHCGSLAEGEAATRPLKEFGAPVIAALGAMPYCQLSLFHDPDQLISFLLSSTSGHTEDRNRQRSGGISRDV